VVPATWLGLGAQLVALLPGREYPLAHAPQTVSAVAEQAVA